MAEESKEALVKVGAAKSYDGEIGEAGMAIVTGANAGIGKLAAQRLLARGYSVVFACRSKERALAAMEDVKGEVGGDVTRRMEFMPLDLGDFGSVRAFAEAFNKSGRPLHVLLNNAGLSASFSGEPVLVKSGQERTFAVNHLGPYLLTLLLLPSLARTGTATRRARVVMVSSMMHYRGKLDFDNLQGLKPVLKGHGQKAYSNSKLCNVLFANELQRRLQAAGLKVTSNSLHPGVIPASSFLRHQTCCTTCLITYCMGVCCRPCRVTQSLASGAHCEFYVATDTSLEGRGGLYIDWNRKEKTASTDARDADIARRLWDISAAMVEVNADSVAAVAGGDLDVA